MENTGPILSSQNVTPRFLMFSISTNILTVLANFLGIQILIFSKNIGHDRGNTTGLRLLPACLSSYTCQLFLVQLDAHVQLPGCYLSVICDLCMFRPSTSAQALICEIAYFQTGQVLLFCLCHVSHLTHHQFVIVWWPNWCKTHVPSIWTHKLLIHVHRC